MKTKLLAGILFCLPFTAIAAGERGGNGGGAILCFDEAGTLSAQLLDLWETDAVHALTIPRLSEPKEDQLRRAMQKLAAQAPRLAAKMYTVLNHLRASPNRMPVEEGVQLTPPWDTHLENLRLNHRCSLRGAAAYDDETNTLTFDPVVVEAMPPTDQAALDFHEAAYKVFRQSDALVDSSVEVRRLTRQVFSSAPLIFESAYGGAMAADYRCAGTGRGLNPKPFEFYVHPQRGTHAPYLQFTVINGEEVYERTVLPLELGRFARTVDAAPRTARDTVLNMRQDLYRRLISGLAQEVIAVSDYGRWNYGYTSPFGEAYRVAIAPFPRTLSTWTPSFTMGLWTMDHSNGAPWNRYTLNRESGILVLPAALLPSSRSAGDWMSSSTPVSCTDQRPGARE